jgi:hypothetical protein
MLRRACESTFERRRRAFDVCGILRAVKGITFTGA